MTRKLAAAIAALTLASLSTSALAADGAMKHGPMMGHGMMQGKMMHGKMVAYCAQCKMYYSPSDAKKMHMMDDMGHKMSMMPMSKVPKGAMMAHGTMMHGKM